MTIEFPKKMSCSGKSRIIPLAVTALSAVVLTGVSVIAVTTDQHHVGLVELMILTLAAVTWIMGFWVASITVRTVRSYGSLHAVISSLFRGRLSDRIPLDTVNCSKMNSCNNANCPEYGRDVTSCFIRVGSYGYLIGNETKCNAVLSGKITDCRECPVMKRLIKCEPDIDMILLDDLRARIEDVMSGTKALVNVIDKMDDIPEEVKNMARAVGKNAAFFSDRL